MGQVLTRRRSTVLGGASQVHARAIPWRLAEGRVSPIQSRYNFADRYTVNHNFTNTLQVLVLVWADGASCCSVRESRFLTIFIQVLRNGGHSRHDYDRVKI